MGRHIRRIDLNNLAPEVAADLLRQAQAEPHCPHIGKPKRQRKRATGEPPPPSRYAGFIATLGMLGIEPPTEELPFHPERKWRFDLAWPAKMLAVEIEGGVWTKGRHTRGKGFLGDMQKYNEAALLGWRVLRVTPDQLKNGQAMRLIERAMKGEAA